MLATATLGRISALLRTRVANDLLVTVGSRGTQMVVGLLGNVLSARALGVTDFGRFGLLMALITVCGTLADAGLTYAAIRMIARYDENDPATAQRAARVYFTLRLLTGLVGASIGVWLARPLALSLLTDERLTPYLQFGFLTLLSLAISSYPGTVLTGLSLFKRSAVAGVFNSLITVSVIVALFFSGYLSLWTLVAWNVLLPIISTLPAWAQLPADQRPWRRGATGGPNSKALAREMAQFGGWMGVSLLASIIIAQGDILLLGHLADAAVIGVYSVALALATRLDLVNQSLFMVLMPRASKLRGSQMLRAYSRRVLVGAAGLAVVLGSVALLAQPAIAFLYGAHYANAAPIFLALLAIVLFDLITSSLFLLVFPLNKSRTLAAADWLRVGVLLVTGWLAIPGWGAWGAVLARGLARVTGTIAMLWALRRAINALPEDKGEEV